VGIRAIRAYRLDRLSNVHARTRTFTPRLPTDPQTLLSLAGADRVAVELRFSARFGPFVQERFRAWHKNTDGTFSAERIMLGGPDGFLAWVLGLGGEVTVVEPALLRAALAERVQSLRDRYAG